MGLKLGQAAAYLRSLTAGGGCENGPNVAVRAVNLHYTTPEPCFKVLMMCLWPPQSSCSLFVFLLCLGTADMDWASLLLSQVL